LNPLLTVDEAAAFLRIKRTTLYTWAYRQHIPTQKVGRALRFRQSDLEKWLGRQSRPATDFGEGDADGGK